MAISAPGSTEKPEVQIPKFGFLEKPHRVSNGEIVPKGQKALAVCEWNGYSIVVVSSGQIKIVDPNGLIERDFEEQLGSLNMTVKWSEQVPLINQGRNPAYAGLTSHTSDRHEGGGYDHYNRRSYPVFHYCSISNDSFPARLRPFAEEALPRSNENKDFTELGSTTLSLINNSIKRGCSLKTSKDGRWVVVVSGNKQFFIAFDTHDASGRPVSPRSWKRYDNASKEFPDELTKVISREFDLKNDIVRLSDRCVAKVSDDKIEFAQDASVGKARIVKTERISGVGDNICVDPSDPNIVYFCRSESVGKIYSLVLSEDPSTWRVVEVPLGKTYGTVKHLKLDPRGRFFVFEADGHVVFVDKFSRREISKLPTSYSTMQSSYFDGLGRLHRINASGRLEVRSSTYESVVRALDQERADLGVSKDEIVDMFGDSDAGQKGVLDRRAFSHLEAEKARYVEAVKDRLRGVDSLDGINKVFAVLGEMESRLRADKTRNLGDDDIEFLIGDIRTVLVPMRQRLADRELQFAVDGIRTQLRGGLTAMVIPEVRVKIDEMESLRGVVTPANVGEIDKVRKGFETQVRTFVSQSEGVYKKEIQSVVDRVRKELDGMTRMSEFDAWWSHVRPGLLESLTELDRQIPIEFSDAKDAVLEARLDIGRIADEYRTKFQTQYDQVRERVAMRFKERAGFIRHEIAELPRIITGQKFESREAVQVFIEGSDTYRMIEKDIAGLEERSPEIGRELAMALRMKKIAIMDEVERRRNVRVDTATGRQMESFGEELFPIWEGGVEKVESKFRIVFVPDPDSSESGPDKKGDVCIEFTNSHGVKAVRRLYEMEDEESLFRYDEGHYRGATRGSYMTQREYNQLMKNYKMWGTPANPHNLRKMIEDAEKAFLEHSKNVSTKSPIRTAEWKTKRRELYDAYVKLRQKHQIPLLEQIDMVSQSGWVETNGKVGGVPEMNPMWTQDDVTNRYLQAMALYLNMQRKSHQGILNLEGHAGTGKDVLVDIFCARTRRPKFSFDCTRWTDEAALGEDIVLEDGNTVKIPSAIVVGMTTPGAVIYLNEFNAMPHSAQIFMHAVFDGKRTMTLKTRPDVKIKAQEDVLFMSSTNYGYPGTFHLQFATESRFSKIEVGYPPLKSKAKKTSGRVAEGQEIFDVSEALRIARNVDSLSESTTETDLERNDFVRKWNQYINGMAEGVQVEDVEKFDMGVILALVSYGSKLREEFMKNFQPAGENVQQSMQMAGLGQALPVNNPLTMREMIRCAWLLSERVTDAEKKQGYVEGADLKKRLGGVLPEDFVLPNRMTPTQVAQVFLYINFLTLIRNEADRKKVYDTMQRNPAWLVEAPKG